MPIVDYISFSVPTPKLITQAELSVEDGYVFNPAEREYDLLDLFASQDNWTEYQNSGLFNRMFRFHDIGITYMEGDKVSVSLVQISGHGCSVLREKGILNDVISTWMDRITRIDVAVDITCDIEPEDFVRAASNQRFKISEHFDTQSGTTWYRGSRKSDRFARVYRYRSPHPRSAELRVEYQFSDEQAKLAASSILDNGVLSFTKDCGTTWGWNHPCYLSLDMVGTKITAPRRASKGSTQFWLYNQVLPAIEKVAAQGDLEFLTGLNDKIRDIIDTYTGSKGD